MQHRKWPGHLYLFFVIGCVGGGKEEREIPRFSVLYVESLRYKIFGECFCVTGSELSSLKSVSYFPPQKLKNYSFGSGEKKVCLSSGNTHCWKRNESKSLCFI